MGKHNNNNNTNNEQYSNEMFDLFDFYEYHDATDNSLGNKKLYDEIYDATKKELEKFIDKDVLNSKRFLIAVELATEYEKMNTNYRVYDKKICSSNEVHPILGPIGIKSWTTPFNKPLIVNHDEYLDPIGRVLHTVIVGNKNYVGSYISDQAAIEKILDKRFYTKSIGSYPIMPTCTICGSDMEFGFFSAECTGNKQKVKDSTEIIRHVIGKEYNGKIAGIRCGQIYKEISYVNAPATPASKTEFYKMYTNTDSVKTSLNRFSPMDVNNLNLIDNTIVIYDYNTTTKMYVPEGYQDIKNSDKNSTDNNGGNDEMKEVLDRITELDKNFAQQIDKIVSELKKNEETITKKNAEIEDLKSQITLLNDSVKRLTDENNEYKKNELLLALKDMATTNADLQINIDSFKDKTNDELETILSGFKVLLDQRKGSKQANDSANANTNTDTNANKQADNSSQAGFVPKEKDVDVKSIKDSQQQNDKNTDKKAGNIRFYSNILKNKKN